MHSPFMRLQVAVFVILIAIVTPLLAATPNFYPISEADKKFLAEIADAVQKNDTNWIAEHMVYPLSIVEDNKKRIVTTREQFMPVISQKFTVELRANITAAAKKPLFKNWQGVMVGDGLVWFSEYQRDDKWRSGIFAFGHFAVQPDSSIRLDK